MIIVKVMGGLGNQLFQYAFGKSIEEQCHYRVKYDVSYYENIPEGDTKRELFVTRLIDEKDIATKHEIEEICGVDKKKYNKFLKKLGIYKSRIIHENKGEILDYKEVRDNTYLIGYWQSEIYLKNIKGMLKKNLDFSGWLNSNETKEVLEQIEKCECSVSIHVRGGDYLTTENSKIFGNICTSQYYMKAYEYVKKTCPEAKFFLFSNDVEWTKANIPLPYEQIAVVSEKIGAEEEWIDLYLMSMCKVNIIANSSYSWWAAWLNANPDKIIICPSKWKNDKKSENVICKEWIKMQ